MTSPSSNVQLSEDFDVKLTTPQKNKILADFLIDRRSAIATYSAQGVTTPEGRWVDKQFSRSTNGGMSFLFVGVICGFYVAHLYWHLRSQAGVIDEASPSHNVVYVALFLGVLAAILLAMIGAKRTAYFFFSHKFRKAKRSEFQNILSRVEYQSVIDNEISEDPIPNADRSIWRSASVWLRQVSLRAWILFSFFIPFNYKFIWWWTLIVGVATAEMEYLAKIYGSTPDKPSDLWLSFMRAIIISVIAYIATNIIRELLSLREYYLSGVTSAKKGAVIADQLISSLSSFANKEVPKLINISQIAIGTTEIATNIDTLLETTKPEYTLLLPQSNIFVTNLKRVVKNFIEQIKNVRDPFIKQCVLLTLNRYLLSEAEILEDEQKRIISRFSTLADIGRELITSLYPGSDVVLPDPNNPEFYGLMVIPPIKFLNYNESVRIGDPKWEDYLKSHIQAAKRKIPVVKYFLSLTGSNPSELARIDNETSSEVLDLHCTNICDQLDSHVRIGAHGIPEPQRVGPGAHDMRYPIERLPLDTSEWRRLRDLIDDTYHTSGKCFIREFTKAQFMENLWDGERKLPLDYFAIRKNQEWIFCLQTRYHKNLDAADIKVFYKDMSEDASEKWTKVKASLDHIFFSDGKDNGIFPIREYRKKPLTKDAAGAES